MEVLLAGTILAILSSALIGSIIYGRETAVLAGYRSRAVLLAEEGLEAVRNIRDENFSNLSDGTYGLAVSSSQWVFSGSSDAVGIFTRSIVISSVDANTKQAEVIIAWQPPFFRQDEVRGTAYFTDWKRIQEEEISSCDAYCTSQEYNGGVCRQNANRCGRSGETHEEGGDSYCTIKPMYTCCCQP